MLSDGVISRWGLLRAFFAVGLSALSLPLYAAEEKKPAAEAPAGPAFVRLPAIVLPVVVGNEVTRQIGVNLSLELEEGKTPDDLGSENRRRIVDAFIRDLYSIYDQRRNATQALDYGLIKQRLKDTATKIVGKGVIKEVLILQAYEHRQ